MVWDIIRHPNGGDQCNLAQNPDFVMWSIRYNINIQTGTEECNWGDKLYSLK